MWYVYIIRSIDFPDQEYVGLVLRLSGQIQSARFREISQIPFRPGICEEASLMI